MSDGVVKPVDDANKRSRQTLQQHQSVWLAHWKQTSSDAARETTVPSSSGDEELEYATRKDASEGMQEGCSRFTQTTNVLFITNESDVNAFKEKDMVFNLESNMPAKSNAEEPKPKSNFSVDDFPKADPSERWVKRLKLSSSNPSAQGTKSSIFTQVKISKLFGGIPKSITTRSAAALDKSVMLGKTKSEVEQIMENPKDEGKEASVLSDAWIKRWMYSGRGLTETKSEAEAVCEPKLSLEKQLPSIAAMALMGRALAYLQPCEFRKMGSFTVWNTKAASDWKQPGISLA